MDAFAVEQTGWLQVPMILGCISWELFLVGGCWDDSGGSSYMNQQEHVALLKHFGALEAVRSRTRTVDFGPFQVILSIFLR